MATHQMDGVLPMDGLTKELLGPFAEKAEAIRDETDSKLEGRLWRPIKQGIIYVVVGRFG